MEKHDFMKIEYIANVVVISDKATKQEIVRVPSPFRNKKWKATIEQ